MTGVHAKILGLAAFVGAGLGLARAAHSATGLTACLAECNHAKLSATNKASCRLDCEQDAASDPELIRAQIDDRNPRPRPKTTTPTTPATTPSAPATRTAPAAGPGCKAACDADRTLSVDDRATCKLECDLDPDSPVNRSGPDVVKTPPPRGSSPLTFQLAGPPPSEAVQAGFIDKCYATCQQGPYKLSATDFETCKLDCQTMASVVDVARWFVPDVWTTPVTSAAPTTPAQPTRVATNTPPVSPTPAKTTPPPRASGTDRSAVEICGEELSACNERCTGAVKTKCERGCSRKHLIETDRETCKLTCETDTEVCQGDCLAANATCVNTRQRQR